MQGWFHTEIPDQVSDAIYKSSQKKQFTYGSETSELEDLFKKRLSVKKFFIGVVTTYIL